MSNNEKRISGVIKGINSSTIQNNISSTGEIFGTVTQPQTVIIQELSFSTHFDFPSIGVSDKLYIATDENKIYRFNTIGGIYQVVGSDFNDISIIQGV